MTRKITKRQMAVQVAQSYQSVKPTSPLSGLPDAELMSMATGDGLSHISLSIPADATLTQVEQTLQLAVTGYTRLSEAAERLKPIIGRILLTVQERKLFRPYYENFTDFVEKKVVQEFGFGRSNAFDALKIARAFPSLTETEYGNYGATRLSIASRVVTDQTPNFRETLDAATRMTTEEFKESIKDLPNPAHGQPGDSAAPTVVVSLRVPESVKGEWLGLLEITGKPAGDLFSDLLRVFKATQAIPSSSQSPSPSNPSQPPPIRH